MDRKCDFIWLEIFFSCQICCLNFVVIDVNLLLVSTSVCVDDERVKSAARNNLNSPDYMDPEDFHLRMNYYKKQYETLGDDEGSYIRTHDSGKSLNLHLINGFLRTKIASFVMNLAALHTSNRPIYMTRAGETQVGTNDKSDERVTRH